MVMGLDRLLRVCLVLKIRKFKKKVGMNRMLRLFVGTCLASPTRKIYYRISILFSISFKQQSNNIIIISSTFSNNLTSKFGKVSSHRYQTQMINRYTRKMTLSKVSIY